MWVMSKENDSIAISKQWKSASLDGGTNEWWLTIAGISKGTLIILNMTDDQKREKN